VPSNLARLRWLIGRVRYSEATPPADFDTYAARYDAAVNRSISFTRRDADFFAERKVALLRSLALRTIGSLADLTLLDVGCGTGTVSRHLVAEVRQLYGVDVSKEMIAIARDSVPGAHFEWYDGTVLPFDDNSVDVVITVCVLHHVSPPLRPDFISELHRVTRHNGLIVLFEHNPLNPLTRLAVHSCDLDRGVSLVWGRRATALLRGGGANVVGITNFLFTPFVGNLGLRVDRAFSWLPLGGQYAIAARAQHSNR
jgi:SAM-dependent methyltransferase